MNKIRLITAFVVFIALSTRARAAVETTHEIAKPPSVSGVSPIAPIQDQPFSLAYQDVNKAIQSDFAAWKLKDPYSNRSTTWPSGDENKAVLAGLQNLSPKERAALQVEVKQRFPDQSRVPAAFALLLSPKDDQAWSRLFDLTTVMSDENQHLHYNFLEYTLGLISPHVQEMPSSTRLNLLKRSAQRYPDAPKDARSNWVAYGPKRSIDIWLRVLIPSDEIFNATYKRTKNPLKSYQAYLNRVKSDLIEKNKKKASLYGNLKAEDILNLARAAQKSLRDAGYSGKEPRILFHGSVTKGLAKKRRRARRTAKAQPASDLDVLTLGLPDAAYPSDNMRKVAEKDFPDLDLQFSEPHSFTKKGNGRTYRAQYNGNIEYMSLKEPFLIEVTAGRIDLLVIPSRDEKGLIKSTAVNCDTGLNCVRYRLK